MLEMFVGLKSLLCALCQVGGDRRDECSSCTARISSVSSFDDLPLRKVWKGEMRVSEMTRGQKKYNQWGEAE